MAVLASLRNGRRDGSLAVVSSDRRRFLPGPVPTLQAALDDWEEAEPAIAAAADELRRGGGRDLDPERLLAPLPRAYQYCEGSAYLSHMERCRGARGAPLPPGHGEDAVVLVGASDRFLAPAEPIELGDEAWGLDLEGTVAVVVADVPAGAGRERAAAAIRLLVLLDDLSLRNLLPGEFATGLGLYQSKPVRQFAPFALTPEEAGECWDGALLQARLECRVRGELLGDPATGEDCSFDFPALIAHAARTKPLAAGTIVGSGTVSNRDERRGFSCLAEKRAVEALAGKEELTPYLGFGDEVRIEAFGPAGSLFGAIGAEVVPL